MKQRLLPALCLLLAALLLAGCGAPKAEQIQSITISHVFYGQLNPEYKIDITGRSFWAYRCKVEDYTPRDATAENEGFTLVSTLSEEAVSAFLAECDRHRFTAWRKEYIDENVYDGYQCTLTILYLDGTTHTVFISNRFPGNWDKMSEAFRQLLGSSVL